MAAGGSTELCELRSGNDSGVKEVAKFGTREEAFTMAKSCVSSAASGIWSATGGKVEGAVDTVKAVASFASSPIATMSKMSDSLKQTYNAIGDIYSQGWSFFATLPPAMVSDLVCSMGSAIATEGLITLLTGGANSLSMAARVLKYLETIKALSLLKSLAQRLGLSLTELFKTVQGLNADARAKLNELMTSKEGRGRVEKLMVSCSI